MSMTLLRVASEFSCSPCVNRRQHQRGFLRRFVAFNLGLRPAYQRQLFSEPERTAGIREGRARTQAAGP